MTSNIPPAEDSHEPQAQPAQDPAPVAAAAQPVAAAASQPAWAKPAQVFVTQETEPLAYHRLLRGTANYRWWRPIVLLALAGVYFGIFTVIVSFAAAPLVLAFDPSYLNDVMVDPSAMLDTQRPVSIVVSMFSIIVMIPSVLLAMLTLGMKPAGRIWSVAGRLRWGLMAKCFGAAVAGVAVMNVVGMALAAVIEPELVSGTLAKDQPGFDWNLALISALLVLVLVPFQSAAEEVVFRGLFMQVLGSWVRSPWLAILLPTIGFAAAHIYDIWGLAAVGMMGGVAAWITWRTGGLEAAIAIHVVNNWVAFGFMTAGLGESTGQTESGSGLSGVIGEFFGLAVFAWLAVIIFKRGGYGRERIDLVVRSVPAATLTHPINTTEQTA